MALTRTVANQLIPLLPTERLIQAIGNLEQRDRLAPLYQEAWAEIDRCLSDPATVEAFGPGLLDMTFRMVLQRLHRDHPEHQISIWLQDYLEQHTWMVLWAIVRNGLSIGWHRIRRWWRFGW